MPYIYDAGPGQVYAIGGANPVIHMATNTSYVAHKQAEINVYCGISKVATFTIDQGAQFRFNALDMGANRNGDFEIISGSFSYKSYQVNHNCMGIRSSWIVNRIMKVFGKDLGSDGTEFTVTSIGPFFATLSVKNGKCMYNGQPSMEVLAGSVPYKFYRSSGMPAVSSFP